MSANPEAVAFIRRVADASKPHTERLARQVSPGGVKQGSEYKCKAPHRQNNSRNFSINIGGGVKGGSWCDWGAPDQPAGHDVVSYAAYVKKISNLEAAIMIGRELGIVNPFEGRREVKGEFVDNKKIPRVPPPPETNIRYEHTGNPRTGDPGLGVPHEVFVYYDRHGDPRFSVCKWHLPSWKRNDPSLGKLKKTTRFFDEVAAGLGSIPWKEPTGPHPPYRLLHALKHADKPIVIVEGEQTARALARLVKENWPKQPPPWIPLSWAGGGGEKAVRKTDWSVLRGRRVLIFPDNDAKGRRVIKWLCSEAVSHKAARVKVVEPGHRRERGWDVADYDPETDGDFKTFFTELVDEAVSPAEWADLEAVRQSFKAPARRRRGFIPLEDSKRPFRILGFVHEKNKDTNLYVFISKSTGKIVKLSPSQIVKREHLTELAAMKWWVDNHWHGPDEEDDAGGLGKRKGGVPWQSCGQQLKELAQRHGEIDINDARRGRGCHKMGGEIVYHDGQQVFRGGEWWEPLDVEHRRLIFQSEREIGIPVVESATDREIRQMTVLSRSFSFRHGDLAADLALGWCFAAPWCGILSWRPHVFLTGATSAGKSTFLTEVVQRVVGEFSIPVIGSVSEPGVRRALEFHAQPITFDEAEEKGGGTAYRMQKIQDIVKLLRAAAAPTGLVRLGDGTAFPLRTMAFLVAIHPSLNEAADINRFLILHLDAPKDPTRDEMARRTHALNAMTGELPDDFWARAFWRLWARQELFLLALRSFKKAASEKLLNHRLGDLVAAPMAAFYTMTAEDPDLGVSPAAARDFLNGYAMWGTLFSQARVRDEENMTDEILSVRLSMGGLTIGGALARVYIADSMGMDCYRRHFDDGAADDEGRMDGGEAEWKDAVNKIRRELAVYGFKVAPQAGDAFSVLVANNNTPLQDALRRSGSPWQDARTRHSVWLRIDGARAVQGVSFSGKTHRAIMVPVESLGINIDSIESAEIKGEDGDDGGG